MLTNAIVLRDFFLIGLFFLIYSYCGAQELNNESSRDINNSKGLDSTYHSDVLGITENEIIRGKDAMKMYLQDFSTKYGLRQDSKTHFKISVVSELEYEIGSFITAKGVRFAHLVIWRKENGKRQKIAEVVYEMVGNDNHKKAISEINESRNNWVKLCNMKNVKNLVSNLYTNDAIYYNRGRVLRGHSELSQEYVYMEGSSYTLQLNPEHIELVSNDVAFEIGKCSGSYNLPYILIWKKQNDGSWKIFMDSNY